MTIQTAGQMAKMGRKEGLLSAARIASRIANQLAKIANAAHEEFMNGDGSAELYESYSDRAGVAFEIASRIKRAAKRSNLKELGR